MKGNDKIKGYTSIPCSISSERVVTMTNIYNLVKYDMNNYWFHWIIKNVNNPSEYVSGEVFKLVYSS